MNKLFAIVPAVLLACSATENAEKVEVGSIAQPIFMPNNYGLEGDGNAFRCSPPWGGSQCWVPDNTGNNVFLRFFIDDASCNTFYKDRIHAAYNLFATHMVSLGLQVALVAKIDSHYIIKCGTNSPGVMGHFSPVSQEVVHTSFGDLVQHGSGNTTIDMAIINATSCMQQGTFTNQQNFIRNLVTHELYHIAGIGHEVSGFSELMSVGYTGALNTPPCTQLLSAKPADDAAIDCYNATSGTTDRCAD